MRDILDPGDIWLGTPGGALIFGNKRPVALDDVLTVVMNSGAITVSPLANDFDPEGADLTLISASAALGTAVVETDDTITYTPPAGITGFDTVVYEIADDLDQRSSGQVNINIVSPELSITVTPDNTLVITAETGLIDITVVAPADFAGTYQADIADLIQGPINVSPPGVSGTPDPGQVLSAENGLWIHDTAAGTPVRNWQWQRAGVDIPGETGASYLVQASDAGQALSVTETLTDASGQRSAQSAPATSTGFAPSDDANLIAWYAADDIATVTESAGSVSSWANKGAGPDLVQPNIAHQPVTGTRELNGLNVLDFVGDDFLESTITLPGSGDVAMHMALAIDGTINQYAAVLALDAVNDFQIDAGLDTQFDGRLNTAGIGTTTALSGGPFAGPQILSIVFDRTGAAQAEIFVGNVSRGTMAYTAPLDVTQALGLMTNRSKNAWVDGAVAEIIVTGTTSNRAEIHTYLTDKWSPF